MQLNTSSCYLLIYRVVAPGMEEIIVHNNVPGKVLCYGEYSPKDLGEPIKSKPRRLILFVPGNPGVCLFYKSFADELYKVTQLPIWMPAYAGFTCGINCPDAREHKLLYLCQAQADYMKFIILQYLQGIELIVVAHSLGSWLVLRAMRDEKCANAIYKAFFLFPMFERFNELPASREVAVVVYVLSKFPSVTIRFSALFAYIITFLGSLQHMHFIGNFVDHHTILPITYLCENIFEAVKGRDEIATIKKYVNKIKLYYGQKDRWGPITYLNDLKKDIHNVNAEIDTVGLPHDFQFKYYEDGAKLIGKWVLDQ